MRTLYLLRHAKSAWDDDSVADHDRPLAPRGITAAGKMAAHITRGGIRPALVLCSSARRAQETLAQLTTSLGDDAEVRIERDLYAADAAELLDRVGKIGSGTTSVMMIGHNPGLQELAIELAGDGEPESLRQLHTKFPTAALATLQLHDVDWHDVGRGDAYLEHLVLPRQLH